MRNKEAAEDMPDSFRSDDANEKERGNDNREPQRDEAEAYRWRQEPRPHSFRFMIGERLF